MSAFVSRVRERSRKGSAEPAGAAVNLDETVLDEREPDFACHFAVARAGGIISENVRNLGALDFDPTISLFPVRLGGDADGAPCRAVALDLTGP